MSGRIIALRAGDCGAQGTDRRHWYENVILRPLSAAEESGGVPNPSPSGPFAQFTRSAGEGLRAKWNKCPPLVVLVATQNGEGSPYLRPADAARI